MARRSAAAKAQPLPFADSHETDEQREWLAQQFEALTSEVQVLSPSQWAERNRYLPASVTPMPGLYDFAVTPYLREIVDCMDVESPIREVTFMKGAQVCATTGVLENTIGYFIAQVQTEAVMLLTSDSNMAKIRMDQFITPMIQHSGLEHLIKSSDEKNPRKTGKTDKKMEWFGGGYLLPFGAVNANNLRSVPMRALLRDEVDSYTNSAKQGDPMKLSESRTAAFEANRKTLNISTPLFKGTSRIHDKFLQGDQRVYLVRCLKCSFQQELRFSYENPKTGLVAGLSWELENDNLIPDSVRWLCAECGYGHTNEDKTRLLAPDHGALWDPKAVPTNKYHRSYHLAALYSPVGMQTFSACVAQYLEGWDRARNRMKDAGKLQVFYNNVLGLPFAVTGDRVRPEAVSAHKRDYAFGQIPNKFAQQFCGSQVLVLVCTVDVQKDNLAVAVHGWCRDRRGILVSYQRFYGDTEQLDDEGTWGRLKQLIEEEQYTADDGARYRIQLTLIDSGYRTDQVYRFCAEYSQAVFPVKGRAAPPKNATLREFSEFTTPNGVRAFSVTVDWYKDRWCAALKREWDGISQQPIGHYNVPHDISEEQLKELTREVKRPRASNGNGQDSGFEWHRTPGADNELWDCLVYANLALELLAWEICRDRLKMEFVSWPTFYDICEDQEFFARG
jgi:phage terminase large subunit GpA-like protein